MKTAEELKVTGAFARDLYQQAKTRGRSIRNSEKYIEGAAKKAGAFLPHFAGSHTGSARPPDPTWDEIKVVAERSEVAEDFAKQFFDEMTQQDWTVQGQRIDSWAQILISRWKKSQCIDISLL